MAESIVREKLAACVNRVPGIQFMVLSLNRYNIELLVPCFDNGILKGTDLYMGWFICIHLLNLNFLVDIVLCINCVK